MRKKNRNTVNILNQSGMLLLGSRKCLLLSLFFLLMGISTGAFLELTMITDEKENLAVSLQEYLYTDAPKSGSLEPFLASLSNNLILLLIIFISGLSLLGFPVSFCILIYKGAALGFSSALILESLNADGALVILTSLVPQHLIFIPVFILAASAASNYALTGLADRRVPKQRNLKEKSGPYILLTFAFALAILIACGIEAILSPIVLSP